MKYAELKALVERSSKYFCNEEDKEFEVNFHAKKKVLDEVLLLHSQLLNGEIENIRYRENLDVLMSILTENTGCAEDLEIYDYIMNKLIEQTIVSKEENMFYFNKTSCRRQG